MVKNKDCLVTIVVPCYNEESVIGTFVETVEPVLEALPCRYEILFVNDGSGDGTLDRLLETKREHEHIRIVNLSRNFGKEAALTAGIDFAAGDAVIPMDADLQDPPELIEQLVEKWQEGYDVVLARRVDRSSDTAAKKLSAELFYRLHNRISDIKIPSNVGDYRLMSRRVVEALKQLPENQRFMKGLFAWVGFPSVTVDYRREPRAAGQSSFNAWRLWNFALEGITSFSTAPLRVWLYVGALIAMLSFLYGTVIVCKTLIYGVDVPGYASLLTVVLFLGGIQLMGIGILGEYIGRIYKEAKRRPPYIVENEY